MTIERIVIFGAADRGKPRTRILIKGLRQQNIVVAEALYDIWGDVEDKSQLHGIVPHIRILANYLIAYPAMIWKYLHAPRHDAVFVGYMGHFDVLVLWPFAKLRGAKIIWDAFLSLYDTVVEDRRLASANSFTAKFIASIEKTACAAADVIVLDTKAHADYFQSRYNISPKKLISVWVGAETDFFSTVQEKQTAPEKQTLKVLFYGQFIPLHGIEFIIDAARIVNDASITWTIIGRGQESEKIQALIDEGDIPALALVEWVDYHDLPGMIADADICLGVFGESDKAARVIPNKVFQVLAMGRPLITRDSSAIREILAPDMPGVWLVPPGSGAAIAEAVMAAKAWGENRPEGPLYSAILEQITPSAIGAALLARIRAAI